jgi:hypothetical protein
MRTDDVPLDADHSAAARLGVGLALVVDFFALLVAAAYPVAAASALAGAGSALVLRRAVVGLRDHGQVTVGGVELRLRTAH